MKQPQSLSMGAMLVGGLLLSAVPARAAWIWIEGENPSIHKMNRHPWWYDQVKRDQFSGGDFISNFNPEKGGEAEYRFTAPEAGHYEFWLRANPVKSKLAWQLNRGAETPLDFSRETRDSLNVAADGKPDLRFLAWIKVGTVPLRQGSNTIRFNTAGPQENHGMIDCFVFTSEPFQPRGTVKPSQMAAEMKRLADENKGWFLFDPKPDPFEESPIDLRFLNEKFAGEHGFIGAREGRFLHTGNGEPVRFWGVNGPPHSLKGEDLRQCARMLAKRGVNLVRVHGAMFDRDGEVDPARARHAIEVVEAMKAEGIYTHLSIYFPLWFTPRAGHPWLDGYDGKQHPFAALLFHPRFQEKYRSWWTALLTTPSPTTGKPLTEEPAVFGVEMQNEDSFFFWTFDARNIPDPQLRLLETRFGDWLKKKYGSLESALAAWKGLKVKRDAPGDGRIGFRPLWNMFNEKTARDRDTAAFLLQVQTDFYTETYAFLRGLGFKGVINASNWATASPEVFGPLEKLSYTVADFIDRHGYFGCNHKGDNAAWSIRNGHTYSDRSALRFDAEEPGRPKQFVHPVMDPQYDDKPSMISETTFTRPNRYRSEAPLYYAAYGALQDSDALVHFALDGAGWNVKPNFWMQPWTLMSPALMGQFPAAALIYRRGLVPSGPLVLRVELAKADLLQLKGSPLPQDASFDELRLQDVPENSEPQSGGRFPPLAHYAGRTEVRFVDGPGRVVTDNFAKSINPAAQTVRGGPLELDYGKGVLTINAEQVQAVSGALRAAGVVELDALTVSSDLELGHIVVVSLDGQPLAHSGRMLLQAMSEEKTSGFATEPVTPGVKRILNIGRDPWMMKEVKGEVRFKRADAAQLKVTMLDLNGYPSGGAGSAEQITLHPTVVYYLVAR